MKIQIFLRIWRRLDRRIQIHTEFHPLCQMKQCWHIVYTFCCLFCNISRLSIISNVTDTMQSSTIWHCLGNHDSKRVWIAFGTIFQIFQWVVDGNLGCITCWYQGPPPLTHTRVIFDIHVPALKMSLQSHIKKNCSITWLGRKHNLTVFSSGFTSRSLRERTNESWRGRGKALQVS